MTKMNTLVTHGNFDLEKILNAIRDDLATLSTKSNDISTLLKGKGLLSASGLAIGSTKPNVANSAISYIIAGKQYYKAATAAGTALSGSNVPNSNKYGAWALDIIADGTISIVAASSNAAGYATSALALAGIAAVTSTKVRLGTVSVKNGSAGVFDPGTTDLDTAGLVVAYADEDTIYNSLSGDVSPSLT